MTTGIAAVEEWLHQQEPDFGDIDPDLDLIEAGLVNSIQAVELLVVIERAGGAKIDRREVEADHFRSLRAIAEKFFAQTSEPTSSTPS
ncbi:acyl carrier protein [Nocardia sp. CDC159]|uniref:Acyl carrier protein n=1 Tax=Nocardia pulmonis TaxID=2951408 RepID=A0A9X2IZ45_9NOCA|nr:MULTISPECIES: acyl carrier protein [Nocardia]MCM6774566.1 acyl carrier protein [Nocardia pulmonis]MCM6787369.1 acyl carrier protein [Nocardia sp. CDC159]